MLISPNYQGMISIVLLKSHLPLSGILNKVKPSHGKRMVGLSREHVIARHAEHAGPVRMPRTYMKAEVVRNSGDIS